MKTDIHPSRLPESVFRRARKVINPPTPDLDEKDHEIARLRQILFMFHDEVAYIHYNSNPHFDGRKNLNLRDVHEALGAILYDGDNLVYPNGLDHGEIQDFAQKNGIYDDDIELEHHGECTGHGSIGECKRCHVEKFYDLKSEIKDMDADEQRRMFELYHYDREHRQVGFVRKFLRKIW
tara:strand:- start:757 stop:1293 length:537 start_codon:yes stop_codon:yes gene_type:complete